MALALQRSFDDLGVALIDATFCVFDLETTGGSPETCRITEIGAVKVRGGEVLGEFSSLVDPGVPIPRAITMLTGISDAMVLAAPPIESLLPAFVEFIGDATLVAHNASFDTRFLRANLLRHAYRPLENPVVCTVRLARRLVRDEVPNLQLATLARALRATTEPAHRALSDARATTDVFHALLELAGRFGVNHLDDLLWFQSVRGHPSYRKVTLAEQLPRARGVYLFRDQDARVLYVGKATDLRSRVRSYFGDDRRRIGDLLRELEAVDHIVCQSDLEASVLEARLIRRHAPRYNRAQRGRGARAFLKLSDERFPRLVTSRTAGAFGPVSGRVAAEVREALEDAAPVRTCTPRIGPRTTFPACVRGQIGRCPAPCQGLITPEDYAPLLAGVARALDGDPTAAIDALEQRMERLAADERFEEAADTRARIGALLDAVRATRAVRSLIEAGRVALLAAGSRVVIDGGVLTAVGGRALPVPPDNHPDEPRLIAAWLSRNTRRVLIERAEHPFASPMAGGRIIAAWRDRFRRLRLAGDAGMD